MNKMPAHTPRRVELPGADTVVVFIHGFMGSPDFFLPLLDLALDRGFAVSSLLLPGHGGTVKDFCRFGRTDWEKAVYDHLTEMSGLYRHILLVGHSMGSLLALQASRHFPIAGVMAISTPLRLGLGRRAFSDGMKVMLGIRRPGDGKGQAALDACSLCACPGKLWVWLGVLPRCLDLLGLTADVRRELGSLTVPVLIVQGDHDEVASPRSAERLASALKGCRTRTVRLPDSYHYYSPPRDQQLTRTAFSAFLESPPG